MKAIKFKLLAVFACIAALAAIAWFWQEARRNRSESARLSPETVQSIARMVSDGCRLLSDNKRAEACAYFERALELDPRNPVALNNLAVLKVSERRYDEGQSLLKKALSRAKHERVSDLAIETMLEVPNGVHRFRAYLPLAVDRSSFKTTIDDVFRRNKAAAVFVAYGDCYLINLQDVEDPNFFGSCVEYDLGVLRGEKRSIAEVTRTESSN